MLKTISCKEFLDGGERRGPIEFKSGLNAVLGAERASNSIGKTTFLLIVDFCFGGSSYPTLNGDVLENVGEHSVEFAHAFDDGIFFFSRSFTDYRKVDVCDENYQVEESIALEEFNTWLLEKYRMPKKGCRFRDLVRGYQRIFGLKNYDEKLPLKANAGDSMEKGITRLLKLYGLFSEVSALDEACKSADEELNAFRSASKYHLVAPAENRRTFEANDARIKSLREKKEKLLQMDHDNLLDLEPMIAERVSDLKKATANLKRRRTRLRGELASIEDERSFATYKADASIVDFEKFFPEADMNSIEEIDRFHSKLCEHLERERKDQALSIELEIEMLDARIGEIESEIRKCGSVSNLTTAVLDEYSALEHEISRLSTANGLFEKRVRIEGACREKRRLRDDRKRDLLAGVQQKVNGKIAELNAEVCGSEKNPPSLCIENSRKYSYGIKNDYGTGALTRAMAVLDLAVLEQTNLPCITHDSHLIKQIEDDAVIALLDKYDETDKQVFIAIDKGHSYSDAGMPEVLRRSIVLRLDKGHELFGKAWNVRDVESGL